MKGSRLKLVLGTTGTAVLIHVLVQFMMLREPVYQQKTVSGWVDYLRDDTQRRRRFEFAIDEIGPAKACPFLFGRLRREESWLRRRSRAIWPYLPNSLQMRLPLSKPLGIDTCEAIGIVLRSSDRVLTTTLRNALTDRTGGVRLAALTALRPRANQIGVSTVASLLRDSNGHIRELAVRILNDFGSERRQAIPELIAALRDSDIGPEGKVAVRSSAAAVLGRMGPHASATVPDLSRLLSDGDWEVRCQAATAIWRINGDTNMIATLIRDLERSIRPGGTVSGYPPEQMCSVVLNTVMDLGGSAKAAVPVVVQSISVDGEQTPIQEQFHRLVREAIGKIDPAVSERFDPLVK